jgi:Protein of unknown function (DUF2442)
MLTSEADERIKEVRTTDDELIVAFVDGRTLSVPLVWYPRLLHASPEQRREWRLIADGEGIHWPQIDEDLSAAGLLRGVSGHAVRQAPGAASGQATGGGRQKAVTGRMGSFKSSKTVPYVVEDFAAVAEDVMHYFESQGYEVTETHIPTGGVQVSIRRGGTFKAIIGMKTALNIRLEPVDGGTQVAAGVGIFGQQAIPTMITALVFWPVIISQVWNMAQEAKLDEEAIGVAEESLKAHSSKAPSGATAE